MNHNTNNRLVVGSSPTEPRTSYLLLLTQEAVV
jgi:hypothetical protein